MLDEVDGILMSRLGGSGNGWKQEEEEEEGEEAKIEREGKKRRNDQVAEGK